jgi:hypothetical protein
MPSERHLIIESPEMHFGPDMQAYIASEVARPCKQWIHEVLGAQRETERVKLRTQHFVLLPDVDTVPSQVFSRLILDKSAERWLPTQPKAVARKSSRDPSQGWLQPIERRLRSRSVHWLAVLADTSLRTLRDLRGDHIAVLITLYTQACQKISEDTGIQADQIMAYIHYPPSVYQLHIHFKHPIGPHAAHDSLRIHSLVSVINNLRVDSDYYTKSILQLPVYSHTELYTALGLPACGPHKQGQIQAPLQPDAQTESNSGAPSCVP